MKRVFAAVTILVILILIGLFTARSMILGMIQREQIALLIDLVEGDSLARVDERIEALGGREVDASDGSHFRFEDPVNSNHDVTRYYTRTPMLMIRVDGEGTSVSSIQVQKIEY